LPKEAKKTASFKDLWEFGESLRAYVISLRPIPSLNTRVQHTSLGTIREAKAGGKTSSDPFRGEWSSTFSGGYTQNDEVLIRGGTTAGLYKSLISGNTDQPWDSANWVQLANNNAIGNWT
jgi:hypothetical protein